MKAYSVENEPFLLFSPSYCIKVQTQYPGKHLEAWVDLMVYISTDDYSIEK